MSWKSFLLRFRWLLYPWSRPKRPAASKRPPDRQRHHFDFERLEERASMEDPRTFVGPGLVGLGLGMSFAGVALLSRRDEAPAAETPRIETQPHAEAELPNPEKGSHAAVTGPYVPASHFANFEIFYAASVGDAGFASLEPALADALPTEAATPAAGPGLDGSNDPLSPTPASEGGGGGAEPGGSAGPYASPVASGGAAAAPNSGSTNYGSSSGAGGSSAPSTANQIPLASFGSLAAPATTTQRAGVVSTSSDAAAGGGPTAPPTAGPGVTPTTVSPVLAAGFAQQPIYFEANQGQTDAQAQFLARGHGYTAFLTSNGLTMALARPAGQVDASGKPILDAINLHFLGATAGVQGVGTNELCPTPRNFCHF